METQENPSDSEEKIQVKTEPREEDIKGYAEDTMNELLAIYGYEKVDEGVTKELHLHHFSDNDNDREAQGSHGGIVVKQEVVDDDYDVKPQLSDQEMGDLQINEQQLSDYQASGPSSPGDDHMNHSSGAVGGMCTSAECSDGEIPPGSEFEIVCAWCQNYGFKRYTLNTATESKAFCGEKCFAACRRAYFRRNKVCDWCRHIRHSKDYIDFQDGKRKLQFCSDKCLHQYKMDVFCQETQALGSAGVSAVVDSGAAVEQGAPLSESVAAGAVNSSEESEHGDSNMLLTVAADSSTSQPFVLGNGVHKLPAQPSQDWTVVATPTQHKSKQHANRTVIGVQHIAIAPKVSTAGSQLAPAPPVTQVSAPAAASLTPPTAFPARVTPPSPAGQVIGLQTLIQPGVGNSQVVGRTPVVVRGTHWPPVVRQIPGYVIPSGQQQQSSSAVVQAPRRILPAAPAKFPEVSTSATKTQLDTSVLPEQKPCTPEEKPSDNSQSSGSSFSHLLPPVTVMVPQPVFIPIPYPIPIPIPVPEDTFHAMRAACSPSRQCSREASSSPHDERNKAGSFLRQGRHQTSGFHESVFQKQVDSELDCSTSHRASKRQHGLSPHGIPVSCPQINEPTNYTDAKHQAWQPLFKYKTLQRSASMDLSLARPSEETSTSSYKTKPEKDQVGGIGRSISIVSSHQQDSSYLMPDDTVHVSGESSAKVREALRCHLTKRLSQSALNLTDVGRMPNPQDDLRRCQSLSRLRYLEPNHMDKLPESADGYSSSSHCSSTSSTQRSGFNPPEKEEFKEVEEQGHRPQDKDLQGPAAESDDDDDDDMTIEPEAKRKCLNHV